MTISCCRLKGYPRELYKSLTAKEKSSYYLLKSALTFHFEPLDQSELYRTEFRARTKRDDERLLEFEFAMALGTLASRAFPKMAPAQRDLLSRDQFIDSLTEDDFRIRVRHAKPKSLDDAVKAPLELEAVIRSEAKRRTEEQAVKSSLGISFHEQLMTTMKEMTAALQEVSEDTPRDYRATRGRGQQGNEGKRLASGLRRTGECGDWGGGIGHYQSQCPSFEAVADSKRSKWNTPRPQYLVTCPC